MSLETQVRYLLDRTEIQDKIALYGLGQDLHQADNADKNILEQWSQLFAPSAEIDLTSLGLQVYGLEAYAELMRGKGLKGGGLEKTAKTWQHLEGHGTVKIEGDTATSLTPYFHSHVLRAVEGNLLDTGYWHDQWQRRPEGWRITRRCHQALYTQTFPEIASPPFLKD